MWHVVSVRVRAATTAAVINAVKRNESCGNAVLRKDLIRSGKVCMPRT